MLIGYARVSTDDQNLALRSVPGTMRLLICVGLLVALAGRGLDDALHRMDLATYQRQCSEFGFTPGTDAFARCMQQQAAQRAEENQQALDRIHRDEAADKLKKK